MSASHRKSKQVHARPGQTESQVDPSFQLASTCESVWPGLNSHRISLGHNMTAAVTLFWATDLAAVTTRKNILLSLVNKQVTYENPVVLFYEEWQSLTRDINS